MDKKLKTEKYRGYNIYFTKEGDRIRFSIPQLPKDPGYAVLSNKKWVSGFAKSYIDGYISEFKTKASGSLKGYKVLDANFKPTGQIQPTLYWSIDGRTIMFKYNGRIKNLNLVKADGYVFKLQKTQLGTDNVKDLVRTLEDETFRGRNRSAIINKYFGGE